MKYLAAGIFALALAAASQPDFWDACLAIATAARWQRVALLQLGLVGGCVGMFLGIVVLMGVFGAMDVWMHRGKL